jgi:hypothetical protein
MSDKVTARCNHGDAERVADERSLMTAGSAPISRVLSAFNRFCVLLSACGSVAEPPKACSTSSELLQTDRGMQRCRLKKPTACVY